MLEDQIAFLVEADKLNTVLRRNYTVAADRRENSAEHSWHVALTAMLLAEYSNEPVNVDRVVKMLLVHDIVEIDAGDTFIYDSVANTSKEAREQEAAKRLFGLLPESQANELHELWDEFEAGQRRKRSSPKQSTDSSLFSTITPPMGAAGKRTASRVHESLRLMRGWQRDRRRSGQKSRR
jgi:5'-deoxynucleotidase YfbR-like HD superfamily hydrolase